MTKTIHQAALEMAQSMLDTMKSDEGQLPESTIPTVVDQVLGLPHLKAITATERTNLIRELESRYSVWIGKPTLLVDNDDHEAWLTPERRKGGRLWARYRQYLERGWSPIAVDALDESSHRILGLLEDPKRAGQWDRRGMVVGHVQSGKTSSYTGLICKAVDAGYKVIIVLAGIHNNLRSQTQMRLDEGFLGYETEERDVGGKRQAHIIGVGEIDPTPGKTLDYVTTRHDKGDFTLTRGKNFGINPGGNPLLFVVKKNGSVLKNLHKWLERAVKREGRDIISDVPLLVIDDEADHASVDTRDGAFDESGKLNEEHDPTQINKLIRQILRKFAKSAYVGYTATPFANIYIHEQGETQAEGPDLFPRSFIINLPAPSNYDGPVRIFGLQASADDPGIRPLPLVRLVGGTSDKATEDWMPAGHKNGHRPLHRGEDVLPPKLEEAIRAFVLVCATRRARGQLNAHNSMLIHVTRFTNVQEAVRKQVETAFKAMKRRIRFEIESGGAELAELERLWTADFEPTSDAFRQLLPDRQAKPVKWSEVRAHLADAADAIQIRTINGKATDVLNYDEHKSVGLNVITIGGDKLARGLTLEGLSVSYFLRASKMYDTLMQMGRWFGYRTGYLDLCRLYMTGELQKWFGHITEASEELRREFDYMALLSQTPKDYGLKVQSHPEMMVTSSVKMRNGVQVNIDFGGAISETMLFPRSAEILQSNLDATSEMIVGLGSPTEVDPQRTRNGSQHKWDGARLWSRVPSRSVVKFLKGYRTHKEAYKVDATKLAQFVELKNARAELTTWEVVLMSGGGVPNPTQVGGYNVRPNVRKERDRHARDDSQRDRGVYTVGRLLAGRDETIDLNADEYEQALLDTQAAWQADGGRSDTAKLPIAPSGPSIRAIRGQRHPERGLLLIYPLDPSGLELGFTAPIIGFGISFPSGGVKVSVPYTVNNVFWKQEYEVDA